MKPITQDTCDELGETLGYFKLNLPSSMEDFQNNNGEGIWAVVKDSKLKAQLDNDEVVDHFVAFACNDSCYYPQIKCGSAIMASQRGGDKRPIAEWEFLTGSKDAEKNRKDTIKKVVEYREGLGTDA